MENIVDWSQETSEQMKTPNLREALGTNLVITGYRTMNGVHGAFALIDIEDGRRYLSGHKVVQQQLFSMEEYFKEGKAVRVGIYFEEKPSGFGFYLLGEPYAD